MPLITIENAMKDFKAGKFLIVVDDEDRENEGDLVIAAEFISADGINFMATHGRGLICTPMETARLDELQIEPMVGRNTAPLGPPSRSRSRPVTGPPPGSAPRTAPTR